MEASPLDEFLANLDRARAKLGERQPTNVLDEDLLVVEDVSKKLVEEQVAQSIVLTAVDKVIGSAGDIFTHKVVAGDTLQGIALRYGCTMFEIKKCNHMMNDRLTSYVTLRIPRKADQPSQVVAPDTAVVSAVTDIRRERLVRALQNAFPDLGSKEASFYLKESNWSVYDAIKSCQEDNEWEQKQPSNPKAQTNSSQRTQNSASYQRTDNPPSFFALLRRWIRRSFFFSKEPPKSSGLEIPLLNSFKEKQAGDPQDDPR